MDRVKRRNLSRNSWKESSSDGVIQTDVAFQAHEDKLYVQTHQPNKRAILENNRKLESISDRHTKLARGVRIPEEDFGPLCSRYPELLTGTPEEKQQALTRIMQAYPEYVVIRHTNKYHSVPEVQSAR